MDYKSFPIDKRGYDMLWVVVDWLSKQVVSIPCFKTIIAKDIAEMYI
jgi:hypothetical protein